ncbi:MAG TPA: hypothetical protein PKI61_00045 [bacterium]|nr:hypothetical protein [bacterium]HPT29442.1 hypothetical protein [bacterium]
MTLINLNQAVLNALVFFSKNRPARLNLSQYKMPLVIGSGNAYNTGAILFSGRPMILASESTLTDTIKNYSQLIKNKTIDAAIIISASGGKDSVWELELAKKLKLKTHLLTCTAESPAARLADTVSLYRRLSEPYTYNTSTYLGMILSQTQEEPKDILSAIKKIKPNKNLKNYSAYAFVLPDRFAAIVEMLNIKGRELFGPNLVFAAYTVGQARHAKFVQPSEKELVISLGVENKYFGEKKSRWDIKLPKKAQPGLLLALSYYITGLIQEQKPPYFKKHIQNFCQDYGPKAYGKKEKFDLIVPGN